MHRRRPVLSRELARFAGVGVVNTALDLGAFVALELAGAPVVLANLASTSLGLCFSFVANRSFTFSSRSSDRPRRQLLLFVICTGMGLWVVQPLVILAAGELLHGLRLPEGLLVVVAKSIAIGFGMVWNWVTYSRLVFRSGKASPRHGAGDAGPRKGLSAVGQHS